MNKTNKLFPGNNKCKLFNAIALAGLTLIFSVTVTAQPAKGGKTISPDLFGLFFEDINYSADGGLYAELVQNRSFEYNPTERKEWNPFSYWEYFAPGYSYGRISVETKSPVHPNNPHYMVLNIEHVGHEAKYTGESGVGLKNSGFDGMVIRTGEKYNFSVFGATASLPAQVQKAGEAKITVDVNQPGHAVSPTLFGIFFEDINNSTDGGIYPELVRNRSFEDADTLQYWKFVNSGGKSSASVFNAATATRMPGRPTAGPLNPFNLKSLQIKADGTFKLLNHGYWGMNIVKGSNYVFKLAARVADGFNIIRLATSK